MMYGLNGRYVVYYVFGKDNIFVQTTNKSFFFFVKDDDTLAATDADVAVKISESDYEDLYNYLLTTEDLVSVGRRV